MNVLAQYYKTLLDMLSDVFERYFMSFGISYVPVEIKSPPQDKHQHSLKVPRHTE